MGNESNIKRYTAEELQAMRARGEPTVPSTIGEERATNPFMRARSVEALAERRAAKDMLKG